MTRKPRRAPPSMLLLAAALWVAPGAARADESTDQCVNANTQAQWLRQEGKFTEARAELKLCAVASCPTMVRDDCVQRLDDLERSQPTIVFVVTDPAGNDLSAVTVTLDGRHLVDRLDGTAIPVDAGDHTFTFAAAGQLAVARTFLLREGEKARREHVVMAPAAAQPAPISSAPEAAPRPGGSDHRALAYMAFGAGAAGVVVGSVVGLMALNTKSTLDGECGPTRKACPASAQSDVDAINTESTISTVAFGVGIVGLVVGTVMVLTSHPVHEAHAASVEPRAGVRLSPWIGAEAAGVAGTFE